MTGALKTPADPDGTLIGVLDQMVWPANDRLITRATEERRGI